MFSFVTAETAIAEAPKTQPAQEALKGVQPFIGSWVAESDAYGGFEGNEDSPSLDENIEGDGWKKLVKGGISEALSFIKKNKKKLGKKKKKS